MAGRLAHQLSHRLEGARGAMGLVGVLAQRHENLLGHIHRRGKDLAVDILDAGVDQFIGMDAVEGPGENPRCGKCCLAVATISMIFHGRRWR